MEWLYLHLLAMYLVCGFVELRAILSSFDTPNQFHFSHFHSQDDGKALLTSLSGRKKVRIFRAHLAKVGILFSLATRRFVGPCSGISASKPHLISELSTPLLPESHHHQS